jgi:hypothetical protein
LWVSESRTQQTPQGLISKRLYYVVDDVVVNGATVVNKAQQRFIPWDQRQWRVQLLFFHVSFTGSDILFTRHVGSGIELIGPDGTVKRLPFGTDGLVVISDLPRGKYHVKIYGGGLSFTQPVSISKDQQVVVDTISWLDLIVMSLALVSIAAGVTLFGRPKLRSHIRRWGSRILDAGQARPGGRGSSDAPLGGHR